jgi:hypothetical protein
LLRVYLKHLLKQVLEQHVVFSEVISDQLVKDQHPMDVVFGVSLLCSCWPTESVARERDLGIGPGQFKFRLYLLVGTLLGHPARYWTALFLDHRQVLKVFVRVKKKLSRV